MSVIGDGTLCWRGAIRHLFTYMERDWVQLDELGEELQMLPVMWGADGDPEGGYPGY